MKHAKLLSTLLVVLSFFSSCEKSNFYNNTGGGGMVPEQTADVITAVQDETQSWSLRTGYALYKPNDVLAIYFFGDGGNKMTVELVPYKGVQTYNVNGVCKVSLIQDGVEYRDQFGWIKITEEREKYISAKFEIALQSTFNNINLRLTEGEFTVKVQ